MCCCGYGHHDFCHGGVWGPRPGHPWPWGEPAREGYRRLLEEERDLLARRLQSLDRELEELRRSGRSAEERA
jgi:hypothetical protein